ncbi:MAG: 2-C-methyl-D-erythritol 2,4-cyclodiphosphate synthase [Actinobacteria bacterium]|nr:2-C-methyl-D-erythritol 2,4-cyclodiphosphate synthase [Actinomycetota bacterium]MCL5069467.1 2-C-methyl-D-erythritol 2,4-cyclodiphosphate synthase [Actinomycetota bacterium]
MRAGIGFDVHQFETGRRLVLGGVEIEYKKGLKGHSDADVLIHAIMDAMLGAAGLRDIGVYFPDNDIKYKNISSLLLLKEVKKIIKDKGFEIINIDSTLILEKPKVSAYIPAMIKKLSDTLEMNPDRIGLKATTTEGLGFCGREEGIAVQSIALLE